MSDKVTQIVTITPATTQFGFRSNATTRTASRCSAITSAGISLITSSKPAGTIIRSSRYPITGMKSGIRSIGLNRYASTHAAKALAYHGTLGSLEARKTACASVFSVRTFCRHRSRPRFTSRLISVSSCSDGTRVDSSYNVSPLFTTRACRRSTTSG